MTVTKTNQRRRNDSAGDSAELVEIDAHLVEINRRRAELQLRRRRLMDRMRWRAKVRPMQVAA